MTRTVSSVRLLLVFLLTMGSIAPASPAEKDKARYFAVADATSRAVFEDIPIEVRQKIAAATNQGLFTVPRGSTRVWEAPVLKADTLIMEPETTLVLDGTDSLDRIVITKLLVLQNRYSSGTDHFIQAFPTTEPAYPKPDKPPQPPDEGCGPPCNPFGEDGTGQWGRPGIPGTRGAWGRDTPPRANVWIFAEQIIEKADSPCSEGLCPGEMYIDVSGRRGAPGGDGGNGGNGGPGDAGARAIDHGIGCEGGETGGNGGDGGAGGTGGRGGSAQRGSALTLFTMAGAGWDELLEWRFTHRGGPRGQGGKGGLGGRGGRYGNGGGAKYGCPGGENGKPGRDALDGQNGSDGFPALFGKLDSGTLTVAQFRQLFP